MICVWTQPTRYMGIETFSIGTKTIIVLTQPTRYMGIETSFNSPTVTPIGDTTYSLYGY